jgi:hypothetical protein
MRALSGEATTVAPVARDGGHAVEMVEVGVADEHEVGSPDLLDPEADRVQAGHPVEVAIEEQVEPGSAGPEGGRSEPLDGPGALRNGHDRDSLPSRYETRPGGSAAGPVSPPDCQKARP